MIQTFVTHATAIRSLPDLDEQHSRGILLGDRLNDSVLVPSPERAEENPQEISQDSEIESEATEIRAIEAGAFDENTHTAPTPLRNAVNVGIGVFCAYIVAATFLAVVVFAPGLKLLGFFTALAVMNFVGLPLLLATISVASEDASAQA